MPATRWAGVVRWNTFRASVPGTPTLGDSLAVVGELHGHFYNKHMSDAQHAAAMTATFELVEYLLNRPEARAIP